MSEDNIEKIYKTMLESGELLETFPELVGDWLKDKKIFLTMYRTNEETLENTKFYSSEDLYEESEEEY